MDGNIGNQVLRNYLLHLVPAFCIPAGLYLLDNSLPLTNLFKVGLLFPALLLALKGLQFYFPPENIKDRSIGGTVEYSILNGMVYVTFMVEFTGLTQPWLQPTIVATLRTFMIGTAAVTVSTIIVNLNQQKKLRDLSRDA